MTEQPRTTARLGPGFRIVLFSGLAVAAVLVGGESQGHDARLALPALVILVHALWALRFWRRPHLLSAVAHQTYFLGFLCTLFSILVAIARVSLQPGLLEEPTYLYVVMTLALSSTVVALVAMNALCACADACPVETGVAVPASLRESVEMLLHALAASEVPPAMREMAEQFKQALLCLQQAVTATETLSGHLARVQRSVSQLECRADALSDSLQRFAANSENASKQTQQYLNSVQQIRQVIDAFVALQRKKLDRELEPIARR